MGTTNNIPSFPLLSLLRTHTHLLPPTPRRDFTSPPHPYPHLLPPTSHCDFTSPLPPLPPPHPSLTACSHHFTSMYLLPPHSLFRFSHSSPPHSPQTLLPLTHPKHFSPSLTPNTSPPHSLQTLLLLTHIPLLPPRSLKLARPTS